MPTSNSRLKPLLIAGAVLVSLGAIAASVLTSTLAPVSCLVVVGGALGGMLVMGKRGSVPSWWGRVGLVLGLVVMAVSTVVDGSWVSGLIVGIFLAISVVAWLALARQLLPAAPLGGAVRGGLASAEVTLLPEAAGGWHLGVTSAGGVLMIREIDAEEGDVATWTSVAKATDSLASTQQLLTSQGLEATPLLITAEGTVGPTKVGETTVCSVVRLGAALRSVRPATISPSVLAAHGITPNRAATRQVARKAGGGPTKGKVVHQGRVTKKS